MKWIQTPYPTLFLIYNATCLLSVTEAKLLKSINIMELRCSVFLGAFHILEAFRILRGVPYS